MVAEHARAGEFLVPYGLDAEDRLVSAEDATPRVDYECPECHRQLRRRAPQRKRTHFFHRARGTCDRDRYIHTTAVRLIVQVVDDWKAGRAAAPTVRRPCAGCSSALLSPLPPDAARALPEARLPDLRRRPDVAIVSAEGVPTLLVEVFHSHEVSPRKASDYALSAYAWIEVEAERVLEDPRTWAARQHAPTSACARCQAARDEAIRRALLEGDVEVPETAGAIPEPEYSVTPKKPLSELDRARIARAREKLKLVPVVRRLIAERFPDYSIESYLVCGNCGALAALVQWRGRAPPEPCPPWIRPQWGSGSPWACRCRGCARVLRVRE